MSTSMQPTSDACALTVRAARLARLEPAEEALLQAAKRHTQRWPARSEMIAEGAPIRERRALLGGWACRQKILSDGRRQILSYLLPGDFIGICEHSNPVASTSIFAVTDVVTCRVPAAPPGSGLAELYARSAAVEERRLLAQITRLGRLDARERLADWLLETGERLASAGIATAERFALPITQEMLSDTLGLTTVHVNRTLSTMRKEGLLELAGGTITLNDRHRLEQLADFPSAIADVRL